MKKHSKHTNLARKNNGIYAPHEIAILGTKCSTIAKLVAEVSDGLKHFNLGYFDASHASNVLENRFSEYTFHHEGNLEITTKSKINNYEQRLQFYHHDLVFINGNHYPGIKQIVILDAQKEASIEKRMEQITDISCFISLTENSSYFECLRQKFPAIETIPSFVIDDVKGITMHIEKYIKEAIAPVKGLVLIGGKSTRMGKDKASLNYHGLPQKEHVKNMFEKCNLSTFLSVAKASGKENEIADSFSNLGPFGGICSAFQKDPNSAWLVLATDVPFVDEKMLQLLLEKRDPSKVATTIKGKNKKFPEPLITIYEPKAYGKLLQYLTQGYSCPRKMIINADVKVIEVNDALIRNINTEEEYQEAFNEISKNT